MRSVVSLVAAGAASLLSSMTFAADMAIAPPPTYGPPPVEEFGGWYLRGDIGFSNQRVNRLNNVLDATTTSSKQSLAFNTAGIFGLGAGYKFNNWFRADVTGEYRGNSQFFGTDAITFAGGFGTDTYHATKSEWLFLANAYVDLGTWWCVTPYLGAGIGGAKVNIIGFRDDGFNDVGGLSVSTAYAADASKFNFAWALHAGLSFKVTQAMSIDFGYRYLDMGNGTTGATRAFDGTFVNGGPFTFNHITSHDLKLGVRWMLEPPQQVQPVSLPPLMRRG
jgi:opacity protein-like surface antigen